MPKVFRNRVTSTATVGDSIWRDRYVATQLREALDVYDRFVEGWPSEYGTVPTEVQRFVAELDGGEAFVLVNDHDPKPVYHQFNSETGDEFHWQYRQKDPGEFRVLIGKGQEADSESKGPGGTSDPSADEQPEAPF